MSKNNVYRDGRIHVKAAMCKTCIYRPDCPIFDTPIKAEAFADNNAVVCHDTLHTKPRANAVCAGFYALDKTPILRLADALDLIRKV